MDDYQQQQNNWRTEYIRRQQTECQPFCFFFFSIIRGPSLDFGSLSK